jgi:hypothetical protein
LPRWSSRCSEYRRGGKPPVPRELGSPSEPQLSPGSVSPTSSRGIRRGTRSRAATGFAPPSTCLPSVYVPHDVATMLRARTAGSNHVPSSWFLTTSTVSSARRIAGLLHPAADPGVRRVSCTGPPPTLPKQWDGSTGTFLYGAYRTPRRIPLTSSRTMSPWPLPPCRSSAARPAHPLGSVARSELLCAVRRGRRLRGVAPRMSP